MIMQLLTHLETMVDIVQRHTIPTPDKDHTDWGKAELARKFIAGLRRVTHHKRGGNYLVIGEGHMQSDDWWAYTGLDGSAEKIDMAPVVLYVHQDGSLWARPEYEFADSRFADLATWDDPAPYGWVAPEHAPVAWAKKRSALGNTFTRPATELESRLVRGYGMIKE